MRWLRLALCLSVAQAASVSAAPMFAGVGDLPGGAVFSQALAVSNDGAFVGGESENALDDQAFRWSAEVGIESLGSLAGGGHQSVTRDLSSDGLVAVGGSNSASGNQAFRWSNASGMVGLGFPAGGLASTAFAVSGDGEIVVGEMSFAGSTPSQITTEAFRWTEQSGLVGLGHLPTGGSLSVAYGISPDGSTIIGSSDSSNGMEEAVFWNASNEISSIGDLSGGIFTSRGWDASLDGSVIVGVGSSANGGEAFVWTESQGMIGLGTLPGHDHSQACQRSHETEEI